MIKTESSGGVVLRGNLVLVVSQWSTSWSLPKGHIRKGEDKFQTAKREILEESGVTNLHFVKELGSYQRYRIDEQRREDKSELKTIHMFLYTTNQEELNPTDPVTPQAKWVAKDKVAELLTHPKDKQFYRKILNEL